MSRNVFALNKSVIVALLMNSIKIIVFYCQTWLFSAKIKLRYDTFQKSERRFLQNKEKQILVPLARVV